MGVQGISPGTLIDVPTTGEVSLPEPTGGVGKPEVVAEKPPAAQTLSPAELKKIAAAFGDLVETLNTGVEVQFNRDAGRWVTKVTNRETHQVIKQIPPEELLKIAIKLKEFVGVLLDLEV